MEQVQNFPILMKDLVVIFGEEQAAKELQQLIERDSYVEDLELIDAPAYRAFTWSLSEHGHEFWRTTLLKHGLIDQEMADGCDLRGFDETPEFLVSRRYPEYGKY